uniref:uncharacterized protein n=1 Tax=Myxine glutinosa TaxID=7769 RepID=UPI00358FF131
MADQDASQQANYQRTSTVQAIPPRVTDWNVCCLCQSNKKDTTCPARNGYPESYETLARNLITLDSIDQLPFPIDIKRLDNGSGIASTLLEYEAILHKQCRKKFDDEKVQRAQKRAKVEGDGSSEVLPSSKRTRSSVDAKFNRKEPECLLCPSCRYYSGESESEWMEKKNSERLTKASTYDIDMTFKNYATITNDRTLLAKLATASDLHAMDAYYHKSCSTDFYHRTRSVTRHETSQQVENSSKSLEVMAFAQLVAYVGEGPKEIYKLRDLVELYKQKLTLLGCTDTTSIHSTRLKERLLNKVPGLEAQIHGRDVFLTNNTTIGSVLSDAHNTSLCDDDAMHMVATVDIMRKFILANPELTCPDSITDNVLQRYCSHPMHVFLRMVMEGTRCQKQIENGSEQGARAKVACTLTNTIIMNTIKHVATRPVSSSASGRKLPGKSGMASQS